MTLWTNLFIFVKGIFEGKVFSEPISKADFWSLAESWELDKVELGGVTVKLRLENPKFIFILSRRTWSLADTFLMSNDDPLTIVKGNSFSVELENVRKGWGFVALVGR